MRARYDATMIKALKTMVDAKTKLQTTRLYRPESIPQCGRVRHCCWSQSISKRTHQRRGSRVGRKIIVGEKASDAAILPWANLLSISRRLSDSFIRHWRSNYEKTATEFSHWDNAPRNQASDYLLGSCRRPLTPQLSLLHIGHMTHKSCRKRDTFHSLYRMNITL